jgi:hypothetical protein
MSLLGINVAAYAARLSALTDDALREETATQATLNCLHPTNSSHLAVVCCQQELNRRHLDLAPVVAEVGRRVRAERNYA